MNEEEHARMDTNHLLQAAQLLRHASWMLGGLKLLAAIGRTEAEELVADDEVRNLLGAGSSGSGRPP